MCKKIYGNSLQKLKTNANQRFFKFVKCESQKFVKFKFVKCQISCLSFSGCLHAMWPSAIQIVKTSFSSGRDQTRWTGMVLKEDELWTVRRRRREGEGEEII